MTQNSIQAPMAATVVQLAVAAGDPVQAGQLLLVLEAMKMEHEIRAEADAQVLSVAARVGEMVGEDELLLTLGAAVAGGAAQKSAATVVAAEPAVRADLQEVIDRHAVTLDAQRLEAVAKRRALGMRTARENIADLCDEGSFTEYGALAYAAQTRRRTR